MDKTSTNIFNLYANVDMSPYSIVNSDSFRVKDGKIRFLGNQSVGTVYYIEYRKEANEYDTTADLSTVDFEESSSIRAKYYLADEIRKLWWDGIHQSELSAPGNNMAINANRIS